MATTRTPKLSVDRYASNLGELPLFLFSSAPKSVNTKPPSTSKYLKGIGRPDVQEDSMDSAFGRRPIQSNPATYSLMYDPRVCRGSYLMEVGTAENFPNYPDFEMIKKDPLCKLYLRKLQKSGTPKKEAPKPKMVSKKSKRMTDFIGMTTAENNINVLCQTDLYEELLEMGEIRGDRGCQTDAVVDSDARKNGNAKQRAEKNGDDKETQIEAGELWDFDEAIAPIVDNLGGAVLEQAILELMQEEELDKLRDQQRAFEVVKEAGMERLRRLQERQQKIVEANAKEVEEQIKQVDKAIEVGDQISVALFSKNYLSTMTSKTIDAAHDEGILEDSKGVQKEESDSVVAQWMESETNQLVTRNLLSRAILDDIIRSRLSENVQQSDVDNVRNLSEVTDAINTEEEESKMETETEDEWDTEGNVDEE